MDFECDYIERYLSHRRKLKEETVINLDSRRKECLQQINSIETDLIKFRRRYIEYITDIKKDYYSVFDALEQLLQSCQEFIDENQIY